MLPIVIRTTDQMLSLVPHELREGSYALGSRQRPHDPHRRAPERGAGIVSGALLAVARAAGETAPLLFTIGFVRPHELESVQRHRTPRSRCRSSGTRLACFPAAQDRAWASALTLILIVFMFTILARLVTRVLQPPPGRLTPWTSTCAPKKTLPLPSRT